MTYALNDSSPKLLIADDERLTRFESIRSQHPSLPVVGARTRDRDWVTPFGSVLQSPARMPELAIDPDADHLLHRDA